MLRQCNNCGKDYEAKRASSKFCSDKCKMAFKRNNQTEVSVTPVTISKDFVTIKDSVTKPAKLSKTDQLFQDDAIKRNLGEDWLRFGDVVRSPKCMQCGDPFKTRLSMLEFCSPKCRSDLFKKAGVGV